MNDATLYYPYTHVRNDPWLMSSLLYWEHVYRIVPSELFQDVSYSPLEAPLTTEGLLRPVDPGPYLQNAERRFRSHILDVLDGKTSGARDVTQMMNAIAECPLRLTNVHEEKITEGLRRELRGRIRSEALDRSPMGDNFGGLWLLALAAEMGTAMQISLASDRDGYSECAGYYFFGAPLKLAESLQAPNALMQLGVDFPAEGDLSAVSIKDFIAFRNKHSDARRRFREAIDEMLATARSTSDVNALNAYFEVKAKGISDRMDEYRRRVRELIGTQVAGLFKITTPTIAVAAASSVAIPFPAAAILAVVGIAAQVIGWWAECRSALGQAQKECPWYYSVALKRRFN